MALGEKIQRLFPLRGDANCTIARDGLGSVGTQIKDDLLKLCRFTQHRDVNCDVLDDQFNAGRQGSMQQRSRFFKKRANRESTNARVPAPSKIKNIVDKVASALRCPANLFDMESGLGSSRQMRLKHFRIA